MMVTYRGHVTEVGAAHFCAVLDVQGQPHRATFNHTILTDDPRRIRVGQPLAWVLGPERTHVVLLEDDDLKRR